MKVLGVDLGSYSIKVAELDVSGKGYVLSNYFEFPLSVDPNHDRSLEIIETLRALSAKYEASGTRWVIGVPQHRVSVHQLRFPFRERPKILKSLPFELEDEIPLDIDETIFDMRVVEYLGPSTEVLTIACPKDAVEETLSLSRDCGFDPEVIGVEGLALSNVFENWNGPAAEAAPASRPAPDGTATMIAIPPAGARLVLHLGHSRSLLLVYRDQSLVALRSLAWGGGEIAESLARTFSVPLVEAVRTLNTKSFILMNTEGAGRDQLRISKACTDSVDNLLRELRLTLLEVRAAFGLEFSQIELTGGVGQLQNLGPYMTQGLEIPVNALQMPLSRIASAANLTPPMEAVAPVAVGLALEALRRPRNPAVNLRKEEFARENQSIKRLLEKWKLPAQVALAAFALFFVFSFVRDQIAAGLVETAGDHLSTAAKTVAGLKGSAATEPAIERHIRNKKSSIKNRESLQELEGYNSAMDVLAKLAEKLPVASKPVPGQGIDVTHLSLENDDLVIEGRALGAAQMPLIEKALNDIARPQSVQKISGQTNGVGPGTPFAFRMKVNRK